MSSPQDRITAFWSSLATEYESHPGNTEPVGSAGYHAWVRVIREALPPPPAEVLDVATGTGFAALIAAGLGHRLTGIDLAEPMLAVARRHALERGLEATFLTGDAVAPDFSDHSFDVVLSRHLLWTLREPATAFENWRKLLRPGGFVVAIDGLWELSPEDEVPTEPEEATNSFERHYTRATRAALPIQRIGTLDRLAEMFMSAGFGNVQIRTLQSLPVAVDGPQVTYLVRAVRD